MNKTAMLMATTTVFALSACGDGLPKANEAEFKKGIEQSVENNANMCVRLELAIQQPDGTPTKAHAMLGEPLIKIANRDIAGNRINKDAFKQMDILLDSGLYQHDKKKTEKLASKGDLDIKVEHYVLTEQGAQLVKRSPRGPIMCIGKQKINKVNWFTKPTVVDGMTISQVSYQADIKLERWASKLSDSGDAKWQAKWQKAKQPRNGTIILVQTNKGWRDARELDQ